MGNENYIQNPELQNEQMKDENEAFNSFINVMVQIVEKYGKTVLQELDAFCRVQRTPMRFRADAVQSTTDALKQCIFSYSRGFITTV